MDTWLYSLCVLVMSIPMNVITIIAFIKSSLLNQGIPVNNIIFNLAVIDVMSSLFSIPAMNFLFTTTAAAYIAYQKHLCLASQILECFDANYSLFGVLLLTCERVIAVAFPVHHKGLVIKNTIRCAIVATCIFVGTYISLLAEMNRWRPGIRCRGINIFFWYVYKSRLWSYGLDGYCISYHFEYYPTLTIRIRKVKPASLNTNNHEAQNFKSSNMKAES